jgi:hypothetical protein
MRGYPFEILNISPISLMSPAPERHPSFSSHVWAPGNFVCMLHTNIPTAENPQAVHASKMAFSALCHRVWISRQAQRQTTLFRARTWPQVEQSFCDLIWVVDRMTAKWIASASETLARGKVVSIMPGLAMPNSGVDGAVQPVSWGEEWAISLPYLVALH